MPRRLHALPARCRIRGTETPTHLVLRVLLGQQDDHMRCNEAAAARDPACRAAAAAHAPRLRQGSVPQWGVRVRVGGPRRSRVASYKLCLHCCGLIAIHGPQGQPCGHSQDVLGRVGLLCMIAVGSGSCAVAGRHAGTPRPQCRGLPHAHRPGRAPPAAGRQAGCKLVVGV